MIFGHNLTTYILHALCPVNDAALAASWISFCHNPASHQDLIRLLNANSIMRLFVLP